MHRKISNHNYVQLLVDYVEKNLQSFTPKGATRDKLVELFTEYITSGNISYEFIDELERKNPDSHFIGLFYFGLSETHVLGEAFVLNSISVKEGAISEVKKGKEMFDDGTSSEKDNKLMPGIRPFAGGSKEIVFTYNKEGDYNVYSSEMVASINDFKKIIESNAIDTIELLYSSKTKEAQDLYLGFTKTYFDEITTVDAIENDAAGKLLGEGEVSLYCIDDSCEEHNMGFLSEEYAKMFFNEMHPNDRNNIEYGRFNKKDVRLVNSEGVLYITVPKNFIK